MTLICISLRPGGANLSGSFVFAVVSFLVILSRAQPLRTDTTLAYKKAAERAAAGSGAGAGAAPSSGSNAAMGSIAQ